MIGFLPWILLILFLLFLEGFLSGSEMAIVAADRKRLGALGHGESRLTRLTRHVLEEPSWYISTALVGSNLAEVANSALLTSLLLTWYGSKGDLYAFLILTPLVLIFGEILPKTLFQHKADPMVKRVVPWVWFASLVLYPFVWTMSRLTGLAVRLLGAQADGPLISREELQLILRLGGLPSDIKPLEKDMIRRIFRFSKTRLREVMIPLVDVVGLEETMTVGEAIVLAKKEGYSRYPVFRERVDHMVGILHSFDLLLAEDKKSTIRPYIRPISFYPESKPVDELLVEMQRKGEAMSAVVDEYGGAVGVVTVEDILEEVVGEIEDEYDTGQPLYRRVGPKRFVIQARMEVDQINDTLKLGLPPGDYATLGGFVLDRLGRIPQPGEGFHFQGMTFEVLKADERSVAEIAVILP
ncbi:MAG: HlyC/CorC family transporter [Deltaproteobacteria bacterium]|nr:HlyC/CorC family transporter [Deltaproteobacteria bacterium]